MTYKSAKDWFTAHNGKRVIKTITGVTVLEEWPERVADIKAQLIAQNCPADSIVENDNGLQWPGGFAMRPKFHRNESGVFNCRSADYSFTPDSLGKPVYGDKKGAKVDGLALVKSYPNGMVIRFIEES